MTDTQNHGSEPVVRISPDADPYRDHITIYKNNMVIVAVINTSIPERLEQHAANIMDAAAELRRRQQVAANERDTEKRRKGRKS